MTKKDYIAMAKALDHSKTYGAGIIHKRYCQELAEVFARDNPKFNKDKFLTACGVE